MQQTSEKLHKVQIEDLFTFIGHRNFRWKSSICEDCIIIPFMDALMQVSLSCIRNSSLLHNSIFSFVHTLSWSVGFYCAQTSHQNKTENGYNTDISRAAYLMYGFNLGLLVLGWAIQIKAELISEWFDYMYKQTYTSCLGHFSLVLRWATQFIWNCFCWILFLTLTFCNKRLNKQLEALCTGTVNAWRFL